tara:strand:+ start:35 stop:412 length:378 start_codon:yes stop_codon:yes gene_type:complete
MNQDPIRLIGIQQKSRKDSLLAPLSEIENYVQVLDNDFEVWSDFDRWENIVFQRWVFQKALDVFKGKKIDLQCNCCEYIFVLQRDFKYKLENKCYGIKTAYMIEKIVDEIVLAKARRETDGTYSA